MSSLTKLKAATSLDDVAAILGFKPSALSYILYFMPEAGKYNEFEIPKRGGGKRTISAPDAKLKSLQRRLANLLYSCLAELEKAQPRKSLSHGFAKGRSVVTNAAPHRRRRFVLNLDLKDFFPSINFGRVRGVLIKDRRFELAPKVATILAQIACHDNSLPQGSPCSPVISNIVAHLLDIKLVQLARDHQCTYSRYADDLTFSTNRATFPNELAVQDAGEQAPWQLGTSLIKTIDKSGFSINPAKTRMQLRGSRQLVTGLLVNERVNIRPEYYRTVRSMCASVFATGAYFRMIPATLSGGSPADPDVKQVLPSLAHLVGKADHIYHVRNQVDRRSSADKKKYSTATRRFYHKLLFYKNFVALDKPLIIPEGKTDTIYLRAAIQRLTGFHPKLGMIRDGKLLSAVRFMNLTSTVHDILQLGGGTGDFKFFMLAYADMMGKFKHRPVGFPVILLIDNDDGASEVFSVAKQLGVSTISHKSSDLFYRVTANLYLVKTPEVVSPKGYSCIEDLFDASVLAVELDGKKFDPQKKHNEAGKYGKARFAEKVIQPNVSSIDFTKFSTLLERIAAVLDFHAAELAKK